MSDSFALKNMTRDQGGFTLLEVLFAMAIAAVGLLSLALMQGNAIEGNNLGGQVSRATFLAQNMLESIKDGNIVPEGTYGYIDMDFYGGPDPIASGSDTALDEKGNPGGPFDLVWQVSPNTDWSRRVTVRVSWNNALGLARTVELESISRGDGN